MTNPAPLNSKDIIASVERLIADEQRYRHALEKLCLLMQKEWGRKGDGGYSFPASYPLVESDREGCMVEDLILWLDSQEVPE